MFHHNALACQHAIERLLFLGEGVIPAGLIRLMQADRWIIVLNPVIAFVEHGGFALL
jgi:hypothetical protein